MLEVQSIRVAYGAATALWDVSLQVGTGELLCVVGPNSAGKTTLINAIAGLNRISAGKLVFDPITKHLHEQLSGPFKDDLKIVPARFGNEAGIVVQRQHRGDEFGRHLEDAVGRLERGRKCPYDGAESDEGRQQAP